MDTDALQAADFVVGVDFHDDGTYGVRFQVDPLGPYPGDVAPASLPGGSYVSAVQFGADELGAATETTLGAAIVELWRPVAAYVPPAPDTFGDGITYERSQVFASAAADLSDVEGWGIEDVDGIGALRTGVRVAALIDESHAFLSEPALADASELVFRLVPPEAP